MDPSWSAVLPVVAYNIWKYYNCTACIDNAWQGLTLYYNMLVTNYSVSPTTFAFWGDWNPAYPEPRTPDGHGVPFVRTVSSITAAAMVVQNFDEAAELALATGRVADAARYTAILPGLRAQYHASFYDPLGGIYGDGTPTAFATALWLGVTPPALLPAVVERFVAQLSSVRGRPSPINRCSSSWIILPPRIRHVLNCALCVRSCVHMCMCTYACVCMWACAGSRMIA